MSCNDVAYPYLDPTTGHRKHVGTVAQGITCATVIVKSNMVEVPIETVPTEDDKGRGTPGLTQFCREYPDSAPLIVTLTAPSVFREVEFQKWIINDVDQPLGQTVASFELDGECIIAFAKYGTDITPSSCSGIIMPSHMLVSVTSACEIIDTVDTWRRTELGCYPQVWQAQGLSLTVVNEDGGANWGGQRFIRDCTPGTGHPMSVCTNNDCTVRIGQFPGTICIPGCEPCWTWMHTLWVTQIAASFGIGCFCDPETNTVTVNYGIGFSKDACRGAMGWTAGLTQCGGGEPGWHCHVHESVFFRPAVDIAEPRTAIYDGTQEDCDAKVRELVGQGGFQTTFSMTTAAGGWPPGLFHEMRCTGIIRAQ